jgi:LysM repeat protein
VGRVRLVNRRAAARALAPAAFLLGFTIAVLLVRAGLADDAPPPTPRPTAPAATSAAPATTRTAAQTRRPQPVFATVAAGDTLDQIALDNDTTVERLLELNPGLDPRELQVGQRVRVR